LKKIGNGRVHVRNKKYGSGAQGVACAPLDLITQTNVAMKNIIKTVSKCNTC
jgi:hypothetical protein